jgi:hypothetical protein
VTEAGEGVRSEIATLRASLADAEVERDAAFEKLVEVIGRSNDFQVALAAAEARIDTLVKMVAEARAETTDSRVIEVERERDSEHERFVASENLRHAGTERETKALIAYNKARDQRNNLLARIHRDGGHYVEEHGVDKACRDADLQVAEAYGRIGDLENLLHATLLWFSASPWTPEKATRWKDLVGTEDATNKALCDAIREVLREDK